MVTDYLELRRFLTARRALVKGIALVGLASFFPAIAHAAYDRQFKAGVRVMNKQPGTQSRMNPLYPSTGNGGAINPNQKAMIIFNKGPDGWGWKRDNPQGESLEDYVRKNLGYESIAKDAVGALGPQDKATLCGALASTYSGGKIDLVAQYWGERRKDDDGWKWEHGCGSNGSGGWCDNIFDIAQIDCALVPLPPGTVPAGPSGQGTVGNGGGSASSAIARVTTGSTNSVTTGSYSGQIRLDSGVGNVTSATGGKCGAGAVRVRMKSGLVQCQTAANVGRSEITSITNGSSPPPPPPPPPPPSSSDPCDTNSCSNSSCAGYDPCTCAGYCNGDGNTGGGNGGGS